MHQKIKYQAYINPFGLYRLSFNLRGRRRLSVMQGIDNSTASDDAPPSVPTDDCPSPCYLRHRLSRFMPRIEFLSIILPLWEKKVCLDLALAEQYIGKAGRRGVGSQRAQLESILFTYGVHSIYIRTFIVFLTEKLNYHHDEKLVLSWWYKRFIVMINLCHHDDNSISSVCLWYNSLM